MNLVRVNKEQIQIISAVTFGNILEWFEIYLFVYWAPILSQVFFSFNSTSLNLISVFLVFGIGFIARPLGALFFGRLGDIIGRKKAFILSIMVMTIPTFLIGFVPTYAQIGIYAPIILIFLRLFQSFPAGGESPGAFCYLYENADASNQKFMTSWGGFGNQLGAILSIIESILMEKFLPLEFLISWGWRISFFTGGFIGLLGMCLRYQLHETPLFIKMREHSQISKETIFHVLKSYKNKIGIGIAYGVINAATFYLIASYIPNYFSKIMLVSQDESLNITLFVLVLTTIMLPFFGILGDKFNCKYILILCSALIGLLVFPMYYFLSNMDYYGVAIIFLIYTIPISCITALIPYLLTHLFPTSVRFTCVGMSFNLADGIIGGFTPAISLILVQMTGNPSAFCWFILLCSIVSGVFYCRMSNHE